MLATDLTVATFVAHAEELGFTVAVRNYGGVGSHVVELSAGFTPDDVAAYSRIESDAAELLRVLPMTYPGTVWGSTSDGVGGHAALRSGDFHLCKSGVGARAAKTVAKGTARGIVIR